MPEYSIFTEYDCSEETIKRNKADLDVLEEKLREFPEIIMKKRVDNSIIIDYNGNIAQLREKVIQASGKILRQSQMPIYIALNADDMYSYKKDGPAQN